MASAAPYPVATEIQIAQVCSFLARKDAAQQQYWNGQAIDPDQHRLLVMESEIIDYRYQNYPSDVTLIESGWYLYALCAPYQLEALKLLAGGQGGIIIDPKTNQPVNLLGVTKMFTVGDPSTSPLMDAGDSGFTVNDTGVIFDTVEFGLINSSPYPRTGSVPANQTTYTVTYTATSITIRFDPQTTASDGMQLKLTYLRSGAGQNFNPGNPGLPSQSGHEGEVLYTDGTTAYWRYPSKKLTSADFNQTDGITCTNTEWEHNSLVIVWDDLPKVLEPNVDYSLIVGGGFQILIPGFDARTTNYNLTVWLTGKTTVV